MDLEADDFFAFKLSRGANSPAMARLPRLVD
jgi:hypothetical protein